MRFAFENTGFLLVEAAAASIALSEVAHRFPSAVYFDTSIGGVTEIIFHWRSAKAERVFKNSILFQGKAYAISGRPRLRWQ